MTKAAVQDTQQLASHTFTSINGNVEIAPDDWTLLDPSDEPLARLYKVFGGPQDGQWYWSVLFMPDGSVGNGGNGFTPTGREAREACEARLWTHGTRRWHMKRKAGNGCIGSLGGGLDHDLSLDFTLAVTQVLHIEKKTCAHCGGPMPRFSPSDAVYCSTSIRPRASRWSSSARLGRMKLATASARRLKLADDWERPES